VQINEYCRNKFSEIENTSSRLAKEAIIKEVMENHSKESQVFLELVRLSLDPTITFNTKTMPEGFGITANHAVVSAMSFDEVADKLVTLSSLRGADNARLLSAILFSLCVEDAFIISRVVMKAPRIGATATTFNKFRPGFIYQHPYMRCSSFDSKIIGKSITLPAYSQLKADGRYNDTVINNGTVTFRGRSGLFVDIVKGSKILTVLESIASGLSVVLMGEMIALDENGQEYPREKSNGMLNSDEIVTELAYHDRIRFYLWDCVPYYDWSKGRCEIPYKERFSTLQKIVSGLDDNIRVVDTRFCVEVEDLIDHFTSKIKAGLEGTVVKDQNLIWEDGTSKKQMKMKVEFVVELEIMEVKEGKGKFKDMAGSLLCKTSDGLLEVGVSGMTDKVRKDFWESKLTSPGRVISVRANGITNAGDTYSLYLPRFNGERDDKLVADDLPRVKEQFAAFVNTVKVAFGV